MTNKLYEINIFTSIRILFMTNMREDEELGPDATISINEILKISEKYMTNTNQRLYQE